jgi:hypothetical protein
MIPASFKHKGHLTSWVEYTLLPFFIQKVGKTMIDHCIISSFSPLVITLSKTLAQYHMVKTYFVPHHSLGIFEQDIQEFKHLLQEYGGECVLYDTLDQLPFTHVPVIKQLQTPLLKHGIPNKKRALEKEKS